ncbi:tetratricopeptide repeat protein [Dyella telluris]|uniref:Sel1 repeat family protein n=1 Tax=Dyella telluris TaxID=2763498 RepID=A0A7G8Q1H0_9GAMM|nr:SEL1-like repeat protein [Dyella telluris]QNK00628.1 sel1 repeat family protein [Dyella telluris]
MAVQKLPALSLSCLIALALSSAAFAGDDATLKKIPTDDQPVAATAHVADDGKEDNTRSFNTPTDDGRPGEYYFALGVQAVKKGDYEHAIAMYKVSASWAYKPAEYNLGVMYLNGQGSPVDLPRALAWMALAAERNDPQYLRARQLVYAHATPEQYEQANVIWRDLLPTYGDEAAMPRAKSRWREARNNATGSRVGSGAAHVEVGGADGTPNHMASPNYAVFSGGHVSTNPAELAGVHQGDGSVAYQAVRSTDNPYDPKVMPVSGQVSVGSLLKVDAKDGAATKDQTSTTDGDNSGHP